MVTVYYLDMPSRVKSNVTMDEDGNFFIVLNAKLNICQQKNGYVHEILHILRNDLSNRDISIDEIEASVHKLEEVMGWQTNISKEKMEDLEQACELDSIRKMASQ